ncbi:MAG: hypothetical protein CVV39_01055 [Planctomycetes bacterium HGW-Planctomycetes-1]|nr:MAG: hypothetical protein CVV39_01055 [Planctomycetes bacterium HGW-Planctomycetes-1]
MITRLAEITIRTGILALTPVQRWSAARKFNSGSFMSERWFFHINAAAIVILTTILLVVTIKRILRERKNSERLFNEYAENRGLTYSESQTLLTVARQARIKQKESIFTLAASFDIGAAQMVKKLVANHAVKESQHLETVLSSLREKLGFKKEASYSRGSIAKSERLSSRQIPVGKEVSVRRPNQKDSEAIEATVVKNNDFELAILLSEPVTITFGDFWNIRYYSGASIWEFESYVVSYDGNTMVLNHNDEVRFINRRRFLRTPVQKPAFIAIFPFEKKLIWTFEGAPGSTPDDSEEISLQPLQFVPALVTELGGPGLRIEAPIEVQSGDRVLIMFELDRKKEQKLIKNPETEEVTEITTTTMKVVEDIGIVEEIGEVKRTEDAQGKLSIAVELKGLQDSDIDCLIRATNIASLNENKNVLNAEGQSPAQIGV